MARSTDQQARTVLTAVIDILLVMAVLLLLRLVVGFFSAAATTALGTWYLRVTDPLAPHVAGGWSVRTPYGGVFSVDTGIVIIGLLMLEWLIALLRGRVSDDKGAPT